MGNPDSVIQAYYKSVWDADEPSMSVAGGLATAIANFPETATLEPIRRYDDRFGSREGEIIAAGLADDRGGKIEAAFGGQRLHFSILVKCHRPIDMPMAGIVIKDLLGNELIKTNTDAEDHILSPCPQDSLLRITFSFIIPPFRPGSYAVSAGFGNGTIDHHKAYDWIENIAVISLEVSKKFYGLIHTDVSVAHEFLNENASNP
jgi:hypothetical protein